MKVIDEKGKLFGKLNVIDLIVIVLIIAALVVVGVKLIGADGVADSPNQSATTKQPGVLTYTVRVTAQDEQTAEFVAEYVDAGSEKRDQLLTSSALVNAYVVDFWTEPTKYNRLSSGLIDVLNEVEAEEAGLVDFYFVIEASVEDVLYNLVGTQEVRVGKPHTVKTAHFEFTNGVTIDCSWERPQ